MMNYNFDIHGVDISPESIKLAKELYPDIIFTIGDIENLSSLTFSPKQNRGVLFRCCPEIDEKT